MALVSLIIAVLALLLVLGLWIWVWRFSRVLLQGRPLASLPTSPVPAAADQPLLEFNGEVREGYAIRKTRLVKQISFELRNAGPSLYLLKASPRFPRQGLQIEVGTSSQQGRIDPWPRGKLLPPGSVLSVRVTGTGAGMVSYDLNLTFQNEAGFNFRQELRGLDAQEPRLMSPEEVL